MDTLFGLPAHSLLIHAPIVLLPIAAIATIAFAFRPQWRHRFGWWLAVGIGAVVVMLFLAKESGEALDDAFDGAVDVSRHEDLANTTFVLAIVWFLAFVAVLFLDRGRDRTATPLSAAADTTPTLSDAVTTGLVAVTSVVAVAATVWLIRTGHEGADVVWGPTVDIVFAD